MKKIVLFLCWGLAAQVVFAQNYYREGVYTDGYDLKAGDITFEVRSNGLDIILDNVTNELLNKPIVRLDGKPLTLEEYEALEEGELDIPSVQTAFRETFTESEYRALQAGKDYMSLYMNISPEGRMTEVVFFIAGTPRTRAVPPEKYALLEKNLKTYLRYRVSDDEKRWQFFRLAVPIAFRSLGLYEKDALTVSSGGQPVPDSELH